MIRIAIADDKPRMAAALGADLELRADIRVVGSYPDGQALVEGLTLLEILPDLVLLDIEMPRLDGVEAARQLKCLHPQLIILMMTLFEEEELLFDAIRAGADGYLLKGTPAAELHRCIDEVLGGNALMSPVIARKSLRMLRRGVSPQPPKYTPTGEPLTDREVGVLTQLATGLKYEEVAANLFISPGTVRKHVQNIYQKLRVNNRTHAVAAGKSGGWL